MYSIVQLGMVIGRGVVLIEVKNVSKSYISGEFEQVALDDVSLKFRKNEFVAILGPSGSGKTTFLNMLGGLDQYDSGDLLINGKSTKNYRDRDWDAYRNNSVGFVFQSYNLISHLSVIDNVEMGMTLSGTGKKEKRDKAIEVLTEVGLKDHIYKKPNQLSGGQMQRVAIARALANDPDIILADEPTGALDSETSVQILDLIEEIAKDKLVVMVTHNEDLANDYANRIVKFLDGRVIDDSNPIELESEDRDYSLKKTSMSFFTALKLSGKNIWAKKWRTLLTSFASSIGIIGIALILSLSNGFNQQIEEFESDTLAGFPVMITEEAEDLDVENLKEQRDEMIKDRKSKEKYPKADGVISYDVKENTLSHENKLDEEFIDYIGDIDKDLISGISFNRITDIHLLKLGDDEASKLDKSKINFQPYPIVKGDDMAEYLKSNYDILSGEYPKEDRDLVMIVDSYNRIDDTIIEELGIDSGEKIDFDNIIGKELKYVYNDDFYKEEGEFFRINSDGEDGLKDLYNKGETLKIRGVIRAKEDSDLETFSPGIMYSDNIYLDFIENSKKSKIVKAQKDKDYNVLTGEKFKDDEKIDEKDMVLLSLGGESRPQLINIYPKNFESKDKVLDYIKKWNEGKEDEDTIIYTDLASAFTDLTSEIMGAITLVLIAFASISLVVSLIMIGIITYISVLERTKEIGVLRALGARQKDITRVFNAETFIIGGVSGVLAIGITYALIPYINNILLELTNLENIAKLNPIHAILLVVISVTLTLIGGFIPAKMAAKQDPVRALSDE